MVVRFLHGTDLILEAEHGLAILAHLAVHDVRTRQALAHAVLEGGEDQIVRAEIGRVNELDVRVPPRHLTREGTDALHQHTGEQEVREYDDAPVAEPRGVLQSRLDQREGHARIADLAPAEAQPFPQHPHQLGHV